MNNMIDIREILEKVKNGDMEAEEAEKYFKAAPFMDLGYAKLDHHRKIRTGFPEVVFCEGKPDEHIVEIFKKLCDEDGRALGTRATDHQYELIKKEISGAKYDSVSRIIKIEQEEKNEKIGNIVVCCAGTADIPVAEEAFAVADYFGNNVKKIYDIGISGLHRLLSYVEELQSANCIIAVAGMEGALPSVLGGLVSVPVIAVPTSVGYGASLHGVSALLTMINSCANGISVVNIDNGFGAGYIASQINRLAERK